MEFDRLFIEDLAESLSGHAPAPGAASAPDVIATTQAVGEEGDQPGDDHVTTLAVGEEGEQPGDDHVTTMAVGEEGEQPGDSHDIGHLADRLARLNGRLDARSDAFDDRLDAVRARVDDFTHHVDVPAVHPTTGTADTVGGGSTTGQQGIAPGELYPTGDPIDDGSTGVDGIDTGADVKDYGDGDGPGYDEGYDPAYDDGLDGDHVAAAF